MVTKTKKYDITISVLKECIEKCCKGYKVLRHGVKIEYPDTEIYEVVFSNNNQEIWFNYLEKNIRNEIIDSFNILILKDRQHFFSFQTYLKTIGIKNPEEKMKLINYEGDFQECLTKFCEFITGIFSNQLHKVLKGDEWINVGMDWGPYK